MKKSILFKVSENTPLILNNLAQWLKNYFPGYAQDILINSAGTTGILLRLISQPLIEKYFRGLTHSRLANSGNQAYLEAALKQAVQSLANIENEVQSSASPEEVVRQFQQIAIKKFENTNNENLLPILQTQYHPIVIHVKESYVHILKSLSVDEVIIHSFRQHFNRHIEEEVRKTFGRDYGAHQAMIKDNILEERITRLLYETTLLSQIGFEEDENLKYETTYGYWKPLAEYGKEDSLITRMSLGTDRNVRPVTRLIDDYFNIDPDNHLSKILFLIADFGKGKSVFLKNYAAELAKKYLIENEGLFPIYFNLRNYNKYDPKVPLGVIGDYLLTEYGIKIDAPAHKHRKYIFLIDSLDEIGELNKEMVSGMIRIVKKIQHLDKELARTNRLIIASRPIANGLKENISFYKPYHFSPLKSTEYFITLYGFKKDQFNDWMHTTLKGFLSNIKNSSIPLLAAIHDSIQNDIPYDLYTKLLSDSTLNEEELRRPIFAYMVYQLMIRNMDILQLGRIGIYLSFLNLLTKEAKHIRDPHYKVSLQKEFEFRNLLHATALLWEYKRNTGQQSALNKADICRILDGEKKYNKEETNQEVLERYRQQGITDIQFLSHSYFGEENNLLYFQHQSFAEMLLAEYYLKIFLKFALEEKTDLQQARIHMSLGTPTPQTIQFLIGLLKLLSETATKKVTSTIIEKRKLLFPILASMATDNNNILFSARTYEEWYVHGNFPAGTTEYPLELLEKWYIDPGKIEKILFFAKDILHTTGNIIVSGSEMASCLYARELTLTDISKVCYNDKWIALLVGNILYNKDTNDIEPQLFNKDFKINTEVLLRMIKNCNRTIYGADPEIWRKKLFKGIEMTDTNIAYNLMLHTDFSDFDLSYSTFHNLHFSGCSFERSLLNHCHFDRVYFSQCLFRDTTFNNIQEMTDTSFQNNCHGDISLPTLNKLENGTSIIFIQELPESEWAFPEWKSLQNFLMPFLHFYSKNNTSGMKPVLLLFEEERNKKEFEESVTSETEKFFQAQLLSPEKHNSLS